MSVVISHDRPELTDMQSVSMRERPFTEDASCVSDLVPLLWSPEQEQMRVVHSTKLGRVVQADCLELLRSLKPGSVHTVFADPPFNLKKHYGKNGNDDLPATKYLEWSKEWLTESVRVLAPGGALFIYNLPKWLLEYGSHLNS